MRFSKAFIPYGGYWSTPFVRWQGSFAHVHPIRLAAEVARRALLERRIGPDAFDSLLLGMTVPAKQSFYGASWLAGLIGAPDISGPTISEACATSARLVAQAACEVELGQAQCVLGIATDRTSNGPHVYYPNPLGPGGRGETEDWVWDNFNHDPYAQNSMIQTAERVSREFGILRDEQEALTLMRYRQYQAALENDGAFQRRFMVTPIEVRDPAGRRVVATVLGDEGVHSTTAEGLARLRPVLASGTVTYGTQTHPADGNCGLVICTRDRARELSRDAGIEVKLIAFGWGRASTGFMPRATVLAARRALGAAGLGIDEIKAIKTHNPFAVNDLNFAREMNLRPDTFNNYGSSLVYGHPQAPTGMRLIMELIEELVLRGGGHGLFSGCAAGDTGAAIVLSVGDG